MKRTAIVSLVHAPHRAQIESLWQGLAGKLGLPMPEYPPTPAFSYQLASEYHLGLQEVLSRVAARHRPFAVHTAGLAVVGGVHGKGPVLALTLVRSRELINLAHDLWAEAFMLGVGLDIGCHPDQWQPHVPLTFGSLSPEAARRVEAAFAERELAWELAVKDLAVVEEEGDRSARRWRFPLEGRP